MDFIAYIMHTVKVKIEYTHHETVKFVPKYDKGENSYFE